MRMDLKERNCESLSESGQGGWGEQHGDWRIILFHSYEC